MLSDLSELDMDDDEAEEGVTLGMQFTKVIISSLSKCFIFIFFPDHQSHRVPPRVGQQHPRLVDPVPHHQAHTTHPRPSTPPSLGTA